MLSDFQANLNEFGINHQTYIRIKKLRFLHKFEVCENKRNNTVYNRKTIPSYQGLAQAQSQPYERGLH